MKSLSIEKRFLKCGKADSKVRNFVDELLLGPISEHCIPVFHSGTKVISCFERNNVLYVNLSSDFLYADYGTDFSKKIKILKDCKYYYLINSNGLSNNIKTNIFYQEFILYSNSIEILNNLNNSNIHKYILKNTIFKAYLHKIARYIVILNEKNKFKKLPLENKKIIINNKAINIKEKILEKIKKSYFNKKFLMSEVEKTILKIESKKHDNKEETFSNEYMIYNMYLNGILNILEEYSLRYLREDKNIAKKIFK